MNFPTFTSATVTLVKSGFPPAFPMKPISMVVNDVTTSANAVPMMNATASSTRFPRRMKALNPVMVVLSRLPHPRGADDGTLPLEDHGEHALDGRLCEAQRLACRHRDNDQSSAGDPGAAEPGGVVGGVRE